MLGLISFFALILQAQSTKDLLLRTPCARETGDSVNPSSTAGSAMRRDDSMWFGYLNRNRKELSTCLRSANHLPSPCDKEDSGQRRISTLAAASTLSRSSAEGFDPVKDKTKRSLDITSW